MKQFFDDFTGTVLTSRGGVRFENGVLIKERIMETEKVAKKSVATLKKEKNEKLANAGSDEERQAIILEYARLMKAAKYA